MRGKMKFIKGFANNIWMIKQRVQFVIIAFTTLPNHSKAYKISQDRYSITYAY